MGNNYRMAMQGFEIGKDGIIFDSETKEVVEHMIKHTEFKYETEKSKSEEFIDAMRDLKDHYINPHERGSPDFTIQYSKLTPIMQAEYRIAKQLRKTLHLDCEDNMKWISVYDKTQTPKLGQIVIAWLSKKKEPACVRYEEDEHGSIWVELVYVDILSSREDLITHWLPIPINPECDVAE